MPDKSVREMNEKELKHYSLRARVFRTALMGAIIPGTAALLIGSGLYTSALAEREVRESMRISSGTAEAIQKNVPGTAALMQEVMNIYSSLDENQRAAYDPEQYHAYFQPVEENEAWQKLYGILDDYRTAGNVEDVYIGFYDEQTSSFICLCGSGAEAGHQTGMPVLIEEKKSAEFLPDDGEITLFSRSESGRFDWVGTGGRQVFNDAGDIIYYVLTDFSMADVIRRSGNFIFLYLLLLSFVVGLTGYIMSLILNKTLVNPINEITEAAKAYAKDRSEGIQSSSRFSGLQIRSGDEVENLSIVMKEMEQSLNLYADNLARMTAEKERMDIELMLAKKIQESMLPDKETVSGRSEFDIDAYMVPAREVGGDFFDFYMIDDRYLALVIADVSGKGIPGSLMMMACKILIENCAKAGRSPKEILQDINEQIASHDRSQMFVTVWVGILDLQTGILKAANGGHEYPVLKKPEEEFEIIKDRHGLVVGALSGTEYEEYTLQMDPGSILFLHTDGVTEAADADNHLFGRDRMLNALRSSGNASLGEIIRTVQEDIDCFVNETEQSDDITMMCIRYKGIPGRTAFITVSSDSSEAETIRSFLQEILTKNGISEKIINRIQIAADELFSNISKYAFDEKTGEVTVRVSVTDDFVRMIFKDNGKPFNPLELDEPDVSSPVMYRPQGGLGIYIVRKLMDEVRYEYQDGENTVYIEKKR